MKSRKIIVTGISGFLGHYLAKHLIHTDTVFGIFHKHQVQFPGLKCISLDLTNYKQVCELFDEIDPDAIIHLAAASAPDYCQHHRKESHFLNVEVSVNLAGLCSDRKIPIVFASTDMVFDGKNPPYEENDPVSPINIYGEQKVEAEQRIKDMNPHSTICRMALMFGQTTAWNRIFFEYMVDSLKQGKRLKLFTDETRSHLSGDSAAKGIIIALNKINGIIHIGGPEACSRFEFGLETAKLFGFEMNLIQPITIKNIETLTPRPLNLTLDISVAKRNGFDPLSLNEELLKLRENHTIK